MITKILIIIFLFGSTSILCKFDPNVDISIPPQTFQFDYSLDHNYLGIATSGLPSTLNIYRTQTMQQIQTLYYQQASISSFAFNQDSSLLIIAFNNGQAHLYHKINNNFTNPIKFKYQNQTNIISTCISYDSKYIIFGFQQSQIVVWEYANNNIITSDFMNQFIHTVSCSKTQLIFVVGGSGNTIAKFTFYTIQNNNIKQLYDVQTQAGMEIYGSTFSSDGKKVYRVGNNGIIYMYNVADFTEEVLQLTETTQTLRKIRVNQNQRLMAISYKNTVAVLTFNSNSVYQNLGYTYQKITTSINSVALSNKGSHLFFVSQGRGYMYGQCSTVQFADENGVCTHCSSQCSSCELAVDICYGCVHKYYLLGNTCHRCQIGCQVCTSKNDCHQCYEGYKLEDGLCSSDRVNIALYFSLAVGAVFICLSVCICVILVRKKSSSEYKKM